MSNVMLISLAHNNLKQGNKIRKTLQPIQLSGHKHSGAKLIHDILLWFKMSKMYITFNMALSTLFVVRDKNRQVKSI